MVKARNDKVLFGMSFFVFIYLAFLYLDYYVFKIDSTLLNVFREMITVPVVFGQFGLLIVVVVQWKKSNYSFSIYWLLSVLVLSISIFVTVWSFVNGV